MCRSREDLKLRAKALDEFERVERAILEGSWKFERWSISNFRQSPEHELNAIRSFPISGDPRPRACPIENLADRVFRKRINEALEEYIVGLKAIIDGKTSDPQST